MFKGREFGFWEKRTVSRTSPLSSVVSTGKSRAAGDEDSMSIDGLALENLLVGADLADAESRDTATCENLRLGGAFTEPASSAPS